MAHPYSMLQTATGKTLPAELFLQTVTCLGYHPGMIETFGVISKTIRELLLQYQYSISRELASPCASHVSKPYIRSSSPDRSLLSNGTYPWLDELHARSLIVPRLQERRLLSDKEFTIYLNRQVMGTDHAKFLSILYDISDSIPGQSLREAQEAWLASSQRSKEELAYLYAMLFVIGSRWRHLQFGFPVSLGLDDGPISLDEEGAQHEVECVYRECAVIYGPCFLQASMAQDRAWFQEVMREGFQDLRSFENSLDGSPRASLQALIAREFCKLAECQPHEVWISIWKILEVPKEKNP